MIFTKYVYDNQLVFILVCVIHDIVLKELS
jgi:hypothetical protein